MSEGFFGHTELPQASVPLLPKCGACKLNLTCASPKMPVSGRGERKILVVGEAPGRDEDKQGRPFVGESGRLLENALRRCGVELRRDCWVTNAVICRPKNNVIEKDIVIDHCRPNLVNTLGRLRPEVVILLGGKAVKSLIGWQWGEDPGGVTRWAGYTIPSQSLNAWVCPTYHPAYLLHQKDAKVATLLFERHLKAACELSSRPWAEPPDYSARVRRVLSDKKAAEALREMTRRGGVAAFDFETEGLKPEGELGIVSCAVCWEGKRTIAYPWRGEAVAATKELLESGVRKVAQNLKFEHRWALRRLKTRVRNWAWDTMVAAHLLDNREGVSGLKFQAYVRFGQPPYDRKVAPYFEAEHASAPNTARKCDLGELLTYNGLDALLEYKIAKAQAAELGMEL
jgi:DNA polymerase